MKSLICCHPRETNCDVCLQQSTVIFKSPTFYSAFKCLHLSTITIVLVTSGCSAEHGPPGSGGVILGHVSRVVDGDPPDGRDVPALGGLACR